MRPKADMERRKRRKNEYPENQAGTLQSDNLRRALAGRRRRCAAVFAVLLTVLFCLMVLSLCTGSVSISPGQVLQIIFLREGSAEAVSIIWKIRLPRLIMAAELGGALSVSGFLLQTYFANPIAGPSVLGISSGAKMAVSFSMVSALSVGLRMSSLQMVLAAFAGALLVTGFVVLASHYVQAMSSLLVAGIMAGYICSAVTDFIVTFADDSSIVNLHNWSRGSFSGMSWEHTAAATAIVCFGLLAAIALAKPMGAFQLGEAYAAGVGVQTRRFRVYLILLSSLLTACVTAYAGPISFVGIAVPFLVRKMMRQSKPLVVIPAVFLGGAVFCTGCDLIARTAFAPTEMNISTVTSVIGAPIVIYMLISRRK